jgi:hypothetical protein
MKFTTMLLTVLVCTCGLVQMSRMRKLIAYNRIEASARIVRTAVATSLQRVFITVHLPALATRQDQVSRSSSGTGSL